MTEHHTYFPVPKLSSRLMRNMEPGDTIIVAAGHKVRTNKNLYQAQVNTTSRAKGLGMTVKTKVQYITDIADLKLLPVVLIHCITSAVPPKKRGRKAGGKNTEPNVSLDEEGVVLYRST